MIQNMKHVELNTKIWSAILNKQTLKIIYQYTIVHVVTGITKLEEDLKSDLLIHENFVIVISMNLF